MRRIGWTAILTGAVASVFGSVGELSDVTGGLLAGLFAAAIVRYTFGTGAKSLPILLRE